MPRHNRPKFLRSLTLAAALIVLLPACLFSGPEKGVSVKALSADLVFGVPPLPEPVGAPNTPVPDDFIPVISNGFSLPPPPPPPTKERCPEADPTDFPDAAPSTITTRPMAGSYEWVVGGYQMVNNTRAGFPTFHNRQVFGVEGTSTGAEGVDTFNFTVREPELTFGSSNRFEKTFEVRSDGLYLIQLTRVDGEGNRVSFNPSPAIQYLTLPVIIGDDIGGSGVDPTTLEAMTLEGTVMRRHRPDACGKFIDSWLVEAVEEVRTLTGSSTKTYHYSIATGLGGLIVYEHIESPVEEPQLVIDARIGQLSPS